MGLFYCNEYFVQQRPPEFDQIMLIGCKNTKRAKNSLGPISGFQKYINTYHCVKFYASTKKCTMVSPYGSTYRLFWIFHLDILIFFFYLWIWRIKGTFVYILMILYTVHKCNQTPKTHDIQTSETHHLQ